jgi:hypothetical protein
MLVVLKMVVLVCHRWCWCWCWWRSALPFATGFHLTPEINWPRAFLCCKYMFEVF